VVGMIVGVGGWGGVRPSMGAGQTTAVRDLMSKAGVVDSYSPLPLRLVWPSLVSGIDLI